MIVSVFALVLPAMTAHETAGPGSDEEVRLVVMWNDNWMEDDPGVNGTDEEIIFNYDNTGGSMYYLGDSAANVQIQVWLDDTDNLDNVVCTLQAGGVVTIVDGTDSPAGVWPGGTTEAFDFTVDIGTSSQVEMAFPLTLEIGYDDITSGQNNQQDTFNLDIYISSIFDDASSGAQRDIHDDLPPIYDTDVTPEFEAGENIQEGELILIEYAGFMISDVEGTLTNIPPVIIPTNGNITALYPGPVGGGPFELYWDFDIESDALPGHYPIELDFTYNRNDTGLIITEESMYTGLNVAPSTKVTDPVGGPTNEAEINITYNMTGTPSDVDLYYTINTTPPYSWILIDTDISPDGYYDWTVPSDGLYGWFAISENETAPNSSTPPEASYYIYDGTPPEVDSTDPAHTEDNVAMESDIILTFDEAMNITSLSYTIESDPGGISLVWGASNMSATISHSDFLSGSRYWVNITAGKDLAGNNLDTLPYSFYFDTIDFSSTATATGPTGGPTNISIISISYTTTNNPAGVELYYTMNTTSPYQWILIETDRPPDGSYMFTLPDDGSYGWNAVASDESPPTPTDAPEVGYYIYDGTSPEITDIEPDNGATGIARGHLIVISFDEKMNKSSLQCTLRPTPGMYFIFWNEEGDNVILSHESFDPNTRYWINITSGKDLAGNHLDSLPYSFYFDTIIMDVSAPSVVSTSPSGTDVDIASNIVITFSEAMNTESVDNAFSFTDGTTIWYISDGAVTWNATNETMTFDPSLNLNYSTTYNVTLSSVAKDTAGNQLTIHTWNFTVMPEPDSTAPTVDNAIHARDEINKTYSISYTFSESMNHTSVEEAISVSPDSVDMTFNWFDNILAITLSSDLKPGTEYEITIGTGATDEAGNAITEPYTLTITTEEEPEDDSPVSWILLIIIIIIIIVVLLLFIMRKGKHGEETRAQTDTIESTLDNEGSKGET
jgi:hypothetical protein